jgi:teichuronic acid biosynthesis glycosyltransferase TuaG
MELVSIIMPYYQKKDYVFETIKHVINQSYKNFELIIIFDENDEKFLKKLQNFIQSDQRIKLILNEKNIGAGESRNIGINHARGNYICFLDSDDLWMQNKIEHQLNFMEKNNYMISHTSYHIINKDDKVIGFREAKYLDYNKLIYSCDVGLSTVMMRKEILKKNIKFCNQKTKEDYIYWLNISSEGFNFFPLKKTLVNWRKTSNSLSSSIIQKLFDGYKVYRIHLKFGILKSILHLLLLSFNFLKKVILK